MKVLVTGSEGYLGIPLTQTLIKSGFEVVGLDTGYYRSGWLYNGVSKLVPVINKDIRNIKKQDLLGFDAVIHLAELSNDPLGQNDPKVTYAINHLGTKLLINLSKKVGIKKFIYFSSCSVYGASDNISDESSTTNPLTEYAKCKVLNENLLLKSADRSFSPTIFRNATVFGPSPKMRFDLAINNLVGKAWVYKEIRLNSDGKAWRPFVHVLDVANAVVAVLKADRKLTHKQIFNIGSNENNAQIIDIARLIKSVCPYCKIVFNNNNSDKRNYRVNFDKIHKTLPAYKSKYNLKKGISELLVMFKKIALDKSILESKNYTRLSQISYLRETKQINNRFFWSY